MRRDHFSEKLIAQVVHWIEEHIYERITLDDLANKAGYSKWHFQRLFYDQMSITAASYIRNEKLYRSIYDLKFGDATIVSIADKYSFGSQQSYTRTFKHVLNCTPSQCRARNSLRLKELSGVELCQACHHQLQN